MKSLKKILTYFKWRKSCKNST